MGVPSLYRDAAAVRSRRGTDLAASGQLPVPDPPARADPTGGLREHGVVQVTVPWAESRSRFTLLFERLAIDVLGQCNVTGATKIVRISWDEAWGLMQRAVTRGRVRKQTRVVRRIGVDENAVAKGHRYLTLVCDLDEGTVEYLAEDRSQESLTSY